MEDEDAELPASFGTEGERIGAFVAEKSEAMGATKKTRKAVSYTHPDAADE